VCRKQGASSNNTNDKFCSSEGCTNKFKEEECVSGMGLRRKDAAAKDAQVMLRREEFMHGAKVKQCTSEGCTNQVRLEEYIRGMEHIDESTAFG